jgi:hypothetical protein
MRERRRSALVAALAKPTPRTDDGQRTSPAQNRGGRLRHREDLVWHLLLHSCATTIEARPGTRVSLEQIIALLGER